MKLHFSTEPTASQWLNWHWQLEHAARTLDDVAQLLGVSVDRFDSCRRAAERYPLFVTPYYLSLAESPELTDSIIPNRIIRRERSAFRRMPYFNLTGVAL